MRQQAVWFAPVSEQPSEVVSGFRRVFSVPQIYRAAQWAVGADKLRNALVEEILELRQGDRVLDIGCGTADILDHMPEVDYVGFDHSTSYIADAAARYADRGRFIAGAAGNEELASVAPRNVAMSVGVLHHLNDVEVVDVLKLARSVLAESGRFIAVDPTFAQGQHPIGRFLAARDRGQNVRTPEATNELVSSIFANVEVTVRHDLLRIPYSHVLVQAS